MVFRNRGSRGIQACQPATSQLPMAAPSQVGVRSCRDRSCVRAGGANARVTFCSTLGGLSSVVGRAHLVFSP